MKISTGLLPITRANDDGSWSIDFCAPKDTAAYPEGVMLAALYLRDEPKIAKRGFTMTLLLSTPGHNKERDTAYRERYAVPEDVQIEDTPLGKGSVERQFTWYEVTA